MSTTWAGVLFIVSLAVALALVYRQLRGEAATLAYLDVLRMLGLAAAVMLPLLLLTRRPQAGAAPTAH